MHLLIPSFPPWLQAMIPVSVPPSQLHLATTIDSFAWSITGAFGAAAGGLLASRLGNSACYLLVGTAFVLT